FEMHARVEWGELALGARENQRVARVDREQPAKAPHQRRGERADADQRHLGERRTGAQRYSAARLNKNSPNNSGQRRIVSSVAIRSPIAVPEPAHEGPAQILEERSSCAGSGTATTGW